MAQMTKGKKRKRNETGWNVVLRTGQTLNGSHAEDKRIHLLEKVNAKVEDQEIHIDSDHVVEPLLVSFPQGCVPSASEDFGFFRHTDPRKSQHRVLFGQTDRVEYKGKNYGSADRSSDRLFRYLIFRYDEGNDEAVLLNRNKLHQSVFEMKQTVLKVKQSTATMAKKEAMTRVERHRKLIDSFGSKKKQRVIQSNDANKISTTQVISASALESVLESSAKEEKQLDDSLLENRRQVLPRFCLQAKTAEEIYPIESLLPSIVSTALKPKISEIMKARKSKSAIDFASIIGETGEYLNSQLDRIKHIEDKKKSRKLARALIFIHYIIKFLEIKSRYFRKENMEYNSTQYNIPLEIIVLISDMFGEATSGDAKMMTKLGKDRLILHALALCLHVEQFTLTGASIKLLSDDLHIKLDDIIRYSKELGCKSVFQKGNRLRTVVLTAPLKFEAPKRAGKPRGR